MATYRMTMEQTKKTKGTVVFTEASDDPDSRPHTFYILKDTFETLDNPDTIEVVIENVD